MPTHLAFTSSGSHRGVSPETVQVDGNLLKHLNMEKDCQGQRQYSTSKLLLAYTSVKELAAMGTEPNGKTLVIVNSLCPGLCSSELSRGFNAWYEVIFVWIVYAILARTAEEGGRVLVSGTVQGVEGQGNFWRNDKFNERYVL
ncbi:hypothetical protein MMC18_009551 [Xylographa bjoerkii]|nr:hypothetical protein [Xylographa bjoerkii]